MKTTDKAAQKTEFQNSVQEIETALAEYKKSFPKNFGDMFRSNITKLCLVFAGYCILSAIAFTSFGNLMKAFFVSLPMIFGAFMLGYDPKKVSPDKLQSMRKSLTPLEEYSDVKKYAQNLDSELIRIAAEKKSYKIKMNIIVYAFIAILSGMLIHSFIKDNTFLRDDLENLHVDDNCGEFSRAAEYFSLQPKEPFQSISPYDPGISPNNIDLFLVNLNPGKGTSAGDCLAGFRFATPEVRRSNQGDKYLLTITDENGNPSKLSFKFTVGDEYVQSLICKTEKEAINICDYVYGHSSSLRYKLEKL